MMTTTHCRFRLNVVLYRSSKQVEPYLFICIHVVVAHYSHDTYNCLCFKCYGNVHRNNNNASSSTLPRTYTKHEYNEVFKQKSDWRMTNAERKEFKSMMRYDSYLVLHLFVFCACAESRRTINQPVSVSLKLYVCVLFLWLLYNSFQ